MCVLCGFGIKSWSVEFILSVFFGAVNKKNWFQLGVLGANYGEAKFIHGTGMRLCTLQDIFIYFLSYSLQLIFSVASIAEGCS